MNKQFDAEITAVQESLVRLKSTTPWIKNEVVYLHPSLNGQQDQDLKAEILRVDGQEADAQVFEDTNGLAIGDGVTRTGQLLSVDLGPGLLSGLYDGLQNPLKRLELQAGRFLPRGLQLNALDNDQHWHFTASVKSGDEVKPGDRIGFVPEGHLKHWVMVPLNVTGSFKVDWIQEGDFNVTTPVARIINDKQAAIEICMQQSWPVRIPMSQHLVKQGTNERGYPDTPLITQQRIIDAFFPIAQGGTACIPGPFGAGKTVLQNLISRYANVDVVIIVACGERAGEIVEIINSFPELQDPQTGGSLMDRTVLICNTSSMPVAAREASIYTGVTIGEYYRQMGYNCLLLADSSSRWAQAMRELSGRLEEIPGEEAFPAYLDTAIKQLYERSGVLLNNWQDRGSLTLVGTVSPAGGNFEEPVTQSTLSTVKTFLGLSAERAYKRYYPAIDPLLSWSRYSNQLQDWFDENLDENWNTQIESLKGLLVEGSQIEQMMQVTGEEGISLMDYQIFQKSRFVDTAFLQQDAFDSVDAACPIERQQIALNKVAQAAIQEMVFEDQSECRQFFNQLTSAFKNWHYSAFKSPEYQAQEQAIDDLIAQHANHEKSDHIDRTALSL